MILGFIDEYPIRLLCRTLEVSYSGFYQWLNRPEPPPHEIKSERLTTLIVELWKKSNEESGSPSIHKKLQEAGETCSLSQVARLMKRAGIKGKRSAAFTPQLGIKICNLK